MNLPLQHSKNAMQQADFLSIAVQITVSKMYCKLRIVAKENLLVIILFLNTGIFSPLFAQNTGDYRSNATGGNWTTLTDWQYWDGDSWEIPPIYPGENTGMGPVTIMDGHTMTLNISPAYGISSLTVGEGNSGMLIIGNDNTDRTLKVLGDININPNGNLTSAGNGDNLLRLQGNLINNGIFDAFDGTTTGANMKVEFYGITNQTISGTGSITDFKTININNTGSSGNNFVEVLSNNFTASPGFLTLTKGILKMSGNYTFSNTFFTVAGYTILSGTGLWLNNENVEVIGQNGTPTLSGSIQITHGTYNIGTSSGNSLEYGNGASFKIDDGLMTIAGRFIGTGTTQTIKFNMSGGILKIANKGQGTNEKPSFDISSSGSSFIMSGGTIIIVN